jgi:hypothetical protein
MWDENKVTKWMTTVGFASFEKQFRGKKQGLQVLHVKKRGV